MTGQPALSLILLAFNEEENLRPVLTEIASWRDEHEVALELIVIDDGSSDETAKRSDALMTEFHFRGKVISHGKNRGMGAGLKSGVAASRAPFVTFLPADGQVPPTAIDTMARAGGISLRDAQRARASDCDLVLSTYRNRNDGTFRRVLSKGLRLLIQAIHQVAIESEGPYLFRRSLFDARQLPSDSFFLNFEFPIRCVGAGLRIRNALVDCRPRISGHSKTAHARGVARIAGDLIRFRERRAHEWLRRNR